ncbi:MAG TPA: HAD-IC family P-type ATPase, partial [Patescibacteria group bacterium]
KELNIVNSYGKSKKQRDFGDERKTRSILRKVSNHYELFTIGAPEEIFKLCNDETKKAKIYVKMQAELGRRVVGVAHKKLGTKLNGTPLEKLEIKMSLVGLISFEDPPREGVKETVEQAKRAGIRTIMVTGDHPLTALNIAKQVGITDNDMVMTGQELDKLTDQLLEKSIHKFNVFARTTPEHKYRIVKALQANKEVVAVTGDGINDTLALKGADIGIAMGLRGTDVAKEAAEVVLADDNYITIAQAIFEGRKFFDNLQKGIKYYLSVKLSLIMIFLLPVIIGIATPMSPIQIIVLELFMDLAASAGFVFEPKEKDIYTRPPLRPDQNVLDKPAIYDIVLKGFLLFTGVVGIYLIATNLHLGVSVARTYAFSAWIFGQLLLALFSRSDKETVVALGFFDNMVINIWGSCALLFLFLAINIPTIGMRFNLTKVSGFDLLTIFLTMLLLMDVIELKKIFFPIKTAPLGSG